MSPGRGEIVRLALPALGSGALEPAVEMLQTAAIGQLAGTDELAALGVCSSVYNFCLRVFNFLESATTVSVARANAQAATDPEAVSVAIAQALWFALAIGGLVGSLIMMLGGQLLEVLGTAQYNVAPCRTYLRVRALGAPLELCTMVGLGAHRGLEDTATPAAVASVSLLLNSGLGTLLMLGGDLGLLGLAAGRLAASAAAASMLLRGLVSSGHLRPRHLRWRPPPTSVFREYLRTGGSMFVRTTLLRALITSFAVAAGRLHTAAAAAHAIARQLAALWSIATDSLAVAAQTLVAKQLSHADARGARETARHCLQLGLLLAAAVSLPVALHARAFATLFSSDPAVVAELAAVLPFIAALQLVAAPAYVLDGVFIGAADFVYLAQAMAASVAVGFAAVHWPRLAQSGAADGGGGLGVVWAAWGALMAARSLTLGGRFLSSGGPLALRFRGLEHRE